MNILERTIHGNDGNMQIMENIRQSCIPFIFPMARKRISDNNIFTILERIKDAIKAPVVSITQLSDIKIIITIFIDEIHNSLIMSVRALQRISKGGLTRTRQTPTNDQMRHITNLRCSIIETIIDNHPIVNYGLISTRPIFYFVEMFI